jgi:hypothetical protein
VSARDALDARVLEWMHEPLWGTDDERFEELALALFAHQFETCAPYQRFCTARQRTPETLRSWREIPAVPAGAFKEVPLRCFPAEQTVHTFRTSGTSSAARARGELHLDTLELYEASLLPSFCRFLLPDLSAERPEARILVLAPSPAELRDSSLSHMFGVAIRELGSQGSGFFVERGELQLEALLRAVEEASAAPEPLLLCGTAFAFVHLLDAAPKLSLPGTARVMETGGFKGRSRSMRRTELYLALEDQLGVPVERIVNQYGMTELGSQFYDSVLLEPDLPRHKVGPPWTRVRIVEPDSWSGGDDECEQGSIVVYDLANTGSVLAIRSADLGRRVADGFEVLGREPGAEERGCSIAADELLG